ncbi:hypothetical protein SLEP1_g8191 [Rubroshorea leprosula]|uniref:Remorin C-terminal domain-containing protein n=1 Tax=Rubroshorea leprosula TaxID=152421 RepID=A0AAV5I0T1_9ROSI|nr:hypothetical protein SLEP1_g8191 [Rubroshorea leprosula]
MKKGSVPLNNLGTFLSPGALNNRDGSVMVQKGWSSERVPHPANSRGCSRRHISAASLTPFYSGRTLPSKWEDAERWVCSPFLGYGVSNDAHYQFQRRPKSKSGPIVPPGIGFYSNCSPAAMQVSDAGGGSVKSLVVGSPFSTGVLIPDGVSVHYGGFGGGHGGGNVDRQSSLVQYEKFEEIKDSETTISPMVSRRDMATQMSPESSSSHSSPKEGSSICSSTPSILPIVEKDDHPSKMEIREVQVDKRVTTTNWSKRSRIMKKDQPPDVEDFYSIDGAASASSFDISEAATSISKLQREEAKISAWENLQRAKAKAAIRKLEVKLEKKRAASMDKILNKVRLAELKGQEMRSSISVKQEQQVTGTSHKVTFFRKLTRISTLNCFTCPAF